MAYGARLESVLGASPRGFESPILRHRTPGPIEVPGFLLPLASLVLLVVPLVFRAPSGPATVCAAGRRPAREPSAPRASLGASSRSPARPRRRPPAPRPGPPAPSTPAALVVLGLARPGLAVAHRHRGQAPPPTGTAAAPSGALHTGGTCGAWTSPARPRRPPAPQPGHAALAAKPWGSVVAGNRAVTALLSPGLVPLRLRGLRRSLRPGVQPGPRPSQRASIGAGPSRCSSIRPSTPSR